MSLSTSPATRGPATVEPAVGPTLLEVRRSSHDALRRLSLSLTEEYAGRVPAGTVIRLVGRSRDQLLLAGVRAGLVLAVESMARARLGRVATAPAAPGAHRGATS